MDKSLFILVMIKRLFRNLLKEPKLLVTLKSLMNPNILIIRFQMSNFNQEVYCLLRLNKSFS